MANVLIVAGKTAYKEIKVACEKGGLIRSCREVETGAGHYCLYWDDIDWNPKNSDIRAILDVLDMLGIISRDENTAYALRVEDEENLDFGGNSDALYALYENLTPAEIASGMYNELPEQKGEKDEFDNLFLWERLKAHVGHDVHIVAYGDPDDTRCYALECDDCNAVILDAELYTLVPRTDVDL